MSKIKELNQIDFKHKIVKDLGRVTSIKGTQKQRKAVFECFTCSSIFTTFVHSAKKSTMCVKCRNITHGESKSPLHGVFLVMNQRCYNENNKNFKSYGGRGITICDEWRGNYPSFREWAFANGYDIGLSIDRIDNNKGYSKENCRWTNQKVQSRNTRKIHTHNTSGYRGVPKITKSGKYVAQITVDNKKIYLGYFESAEDGAIAYDKYVIDNNLEHTINFKLSRRVKELEDMCKKISVSKSCNN